MLEFMEETIHLESTVPAEDNNEHALVLAQPQASSGTENQLAIA